MAYAISGGSIIRTKRAEINGKQREGRGGAEIEGMKNGHWEWIRHFRSVSSSDTQRERTTTTTTLRVHHCFVSCNCLWSTRGSGIELGHLTKPNQTE